MSKIYAFTKLTALVAVGLLGAGATALAQDDKNDLMSPKALHTPHHCDEKLTLETMMAYKAPKANKPYKIAYSMVSLSGYYYQATAYGALQAAKEAGVEVKIVAGAGFSSQAEQVADVNSLMAQGYEGILLNPVDVNGAAPLVDEARSRNIAVVAVGTLVNSDKVDRVAGDSYYQGVIAADYIASKLPKGGQGIVVGGPANATWAMRRVAGFEDGMKKYPNLKISAVTHSDVDPVKGLAGFTNAAQGNPKVDFIYVTYNLQLPPESVPLKYKDAVYIAGGLEPIVIDGLKTGTADAGLPSYPTAVGYIGMARLIARLNGDTSPPAMICLPADQIVTSETLANTDLSPETYPVGWSATESKK